jgi:BirA family biotin operon repressor/biotin-[acetyl-CoA-carboxylase] ligase
MQRAVAGERGPLWIRADVQTQGRGRSGRGWATPSGNFAATFLFAPDAPLASMPQLSLVAGLGAANAVARFMTREHDGDALRLKWPNDLMIGRSKLGGILVETTTLGSDVIAMVGIGINILGAPPVEGRAITALSEHTTVPPSPSRLLAEIAVSMNAALLAWRGGMGFSEIRIRWLERAGPLGDPMSVHSGNGQAQGTFAGLDTDGALLLEGGDGQRHRFTFGDVTLGPPAKV